MGIFSSYLKASGSNVSNNSLIITNSIISMQWFTGVPNSDPMKRTARFQKINKRYRVSPFKIEVSLISTNESSIKR